jgi:glycosyltransferase involved in cell wall biosynthesis
MKNKKICYLIFNNSPSSIVRAITFKDNFLRNKYKITYSHLYSSKITNIANWFFIKKLPLLGKILNKFNALYEIIISHFFLIFSNNFDAIVIIKYIKPSYLNKLKEKFKGKLLYDFDDAVWLDYIMGENNFKKIISNVDYVSCDNKFLLSQSIKYNSNSFILNGPTQIEKFTSSLYTRSDDNFIIGWVGSPDTLFYLYSVYDALEKIGELFKNVIFKILGTGNDFTRIPKFEKIKVQIIKNYDEKLMIQEVKNFDIGIFPLFKNDLSCGRGLLKAKIYMSASVPSISSNIGTASDLIINGENGFLCNDSNDWISIITTLINNPVLRKKIGEAGFKTIKENFSKDQCFQELKTNFLDVI